MLRKVEGNGIDSTGNVKACDVCAIGKNAQQAHPKKATYDIKQPFQLVLAGLMGPMSPPALGGFEYICKFVDQQTKWKEIFLIKAKSDFIDTLKLFQSVSRHSYWTPTGTPSRRQGCGITNQTTLSTCVSRPNGVHVPPGTRRVRVH